VCGRGPLNQTSKSNIFIFYSPPYPPLSFPSPVVIPARCDDALPADPLHPRASGLRPRPPPKSRSRRLPTSPRPRQRLASVYARYLASSAHPANRRGRTWAGSLVVDNAAGRRRTWRLTAADGEAGQRRTARRGLRIPSLLSALPGPRAVDSGATVHRSVLWSIVSRETTTSPGFCS